ncbi:MAG: hypothetical protein V1490_02115 [Candidatus Omnitrophota bacterium]
MKIKESDRIEHNKNILLHAPVTTLFRLRDAAVIMEGIGWYPEAMASSKLLEIAIRMKN